MIEEIWSNVLSWSGQFVVPDWGELVNLIPIGLAFLVFLFVTWTIYRFATAGPKQRGPGRRPPVTPAGIHMPGPSFAPILAAIGGFFMVFGMVTGGFWLWIGLVMLVITLLYWGREATRDYDAIPAAASGGPAAGALPAPAGTPPAGIHLPPPSFRPLVVSMALTMLVAGMVVGGWALLFGAIAVLVAGLDWLRDARREYTEVETADRTGHLESGGAPAWPIPTFAVLAVLVAVGLALGSGIIFPAGDQPGTAAGPQASAGSGGPAPQASADGGAAAGPTMPPADVSLTAENITYTEAAITIPGGKPFTLAFNNKDAGIPHDVVFKDAGGNVLFQGDIVTGPAVTVYDVPAIPPGQYLYICSVHPNMTGTATAK